MALQAAAKSVTVTLQNPGTATLPDNRKMEYGISYVMSLEDYAKITGRARDNLLTTTVNIVNTIVPLWDGTNYALNLKTFQDDAVPGGNDYGIPEWDATSDWTTSDEMVWYNNRIYKHLNGDSSINEIPANYPLKWEDQGIDANPGAVIQGFNGDAFQLVRAATGTASIVAGTAVSWGGVDEVFGDNNNSDYLTVAEGKKNCVVTSDISDLTDQSETPTFAGIAIGNIAAGDGIVGGNNYSYLGWIQIAGTTVSSITGTPANGTAPTAGAQLALSEHADGRLVTTTNESVAIVLANGDGAENFKLTFGGQTTANILWNATGAEVQAALEALSTIGNGNVSVVRTGNSPDFTHTVTFIGDLANTNVGAITHTAGGTPGNLTVTPGTPVTGSGVYGPIGVAVAVDANVADVELRSINTLNRHFKRRNLFFDK